MKNIVVISQEDDAHIPFVQKHMSAKLIVIEPTKILHEQELSYSFDGSHTLVSYGGELLENITSVWYRKPEDVTQVTLPVSENFREYSTTAMKKHIDMLRAAFPEAFWISNYYNIMHAEHKAFQLSLAARLGMRVPHTLLTSDPAKAKAFMDKYAPVIIKSQAVSFPVIDDQVHFFFAKRVESSKGIDLKNLRLAPAIFQQAIDAVADIRVTVMGSKVFAGIIHAQSNNDGVRDWRHDHSLQAGIFEPYDKQLPHELRDQCRKLIDEFGLQYGAIDLVVDKQGSIWFLEINPNGQWAFVEEHTKQPMGKYLSRLLEAGQRI